MGSGGFKPGARNRRATRTVAGQAPWHRRASLGRSLCTGTRRAGELGDGRAAPHLTHVLLLGGRSSLRPFRRDGRLGLCFVRALIRGLEGLVSRAVRDLGRKEADDSSRAAASSPPAQPPRPGPRPALPSEQAQLVGTRRRVRHGPDPPSGQDAHWCGCDVAPSARCLREESSSGKPTLAVTSDGLRDPGPCVSSRPCSGPPAYGGGAGAAMGRGHTAKSGLPRAFPQDQEPGFQTPRTPSSLRDHPVGFRPPRPQGPPEGWAGQARRGLLRGPEKEVDSGAKEVTHRSDFVPPAFIRQPPVRPGRASPSGRTRHLPHLTRSFRRNQ